MNYKRNLENSENLMEIQVAYETEAERRFLELKEEYPDDFRCRMLNEDLSIWLIAEKFAISCFGRTEVHWIRKIIK